MPNVLNGQIRMSPEAVLEELDGEAIVLQLEEGVYYRLDRVGTAMLQTLIAHDGNVERALDGLEARYDASRATLEEDLERFVDELAGVRIVTIDSAG